MGTKDTKGLVAEVAPGVFVSKTKIIICGVILVVLLILVIVLGALLGHTRSKLSGILLSCHLANALVTIYSWDFEHQNRASTLKCNLDNSHLFYKGQWWYILNLKSNKNDDMHTGG